VTSGQSGIVSATGLSSQEVGCPRKTLLAWRTRLQRTADFAQLRATTLH
jgi:hypothetical protein